MTVCVAIENFAMDLSRPAMTKELGMLSKNYLAHIGEMREYMGYGQ